TVSTCIPSSIESAKTETLSRVGQFGTSPRVEIRPTVGLMPMTPLKPAGMRPEPPVSVPSAKETRPVPTTTAEPELEPPDTYSGLPTAPHAPYGDRAGKAGGELIEIGLAEANRARGEQQLDAACRAFRSVAKCRACRRGGHPRYVDIVFHSERHAVKRQAFSGSGLRFNFGARTQRLFARPEVNPSWPDR